MVEEGWCNKELVMASCRGELSMMVLAARPGMGVTAAGRVRNVGW